MLKVSLIKENIGLAGLILFQFGLLFSPFVLSISILFLLVQPFLYYSPSKVLNKLFADKISILLMFYFVICSLGIFYSDDINLYLKDLKLKLPMLLLPIAFVYSNYYLKRNQQFVLFAFIGFTFIAGLLSSINYFNHYEELNQLIFKAKPIPIIANINHIYYSFFLAFAIIAGFRLQYQISISKTLKIVNVIILLLNIVFIHTIAARTGLFAFYGTLFVMLIMYGFRSNKIILTAASLLVVIIIGIASVVYLPVLNNRYQKTLEDVNVYRIGGDINYYSISQRLEYWDKSYKVFLSSPIIGVGFADVKNEMREIFEQENSILDLENRKGPHNQYLEILAGIGILGFIVFLLILFYSFRICIQYKSDLLLSFLLVMIFTFFVESTLERQSGISFFTFMLLFLARHSSEDKQVKIEENKELDFKTQI